MSEPQLAVVKIMSTAHTEPRRMYERLWEAIAPNGDPTIEGLMALLAFGKVPLQPNGIDNEQPSVQKEDFEAALRGLVLELSILDNEPDEAANRLFETLGAAPDEATGSAVIAWVLRRAYRKLPLSPDLSSLQEPLEIKDKSGLRLHPLILTEITRMARFKSSGDPDTATRRWLSGLEEVSWWLALSPEGRAVAERTFISQLPAAL